MKTLCLNNVTQNISGTGTITEGSITFSSFHVHNIVITFTVIFNCLMFLLNISSPVHFGLLKEHSWKSPEDLEAYTAGVWGY